jgi:hypothetical protein
MEQYNNYTPPELPSGPEDSAVNEMIQSIGEGSVDSFTPLSDPTDALITEDNILPFNGEQVVDPVPVDLPGLSVQKHLIGSPDNIPGGRGIASPQDAINLMQSQIRGVSDESLKNQYAQTFQYDNSSKTGAFYERYSSYGNDVMSEVGFHPYVNNEANFVQRTNMWDDASRMLTDSFPALFARGFIDGPKSLAKLMMGDVRGADLEDAEEYAKHAAIGQSSRKGIAPFMNNTVMNFGYTAGIITEAILETVAMSALTLESGGATAGVQAARTGQLGARILQALGKFGSGFKAVTQLLPKISKNPAAARSFFTKVNPALKVLNPLENVATAAKTMMKQNKAYRLGKADSYFNGLAAVSQTAGALYRDVRAANMAISEARLEAGMVENDIFDEVYTDFINKNKRVPTTDEQLGMRIKAKQGSLETFMTNAGIIYVTNQITFRNVVSPKGGIKSFFKNVQKDLYSVDGKYGTLGKVVYNRGKEVFQFEKNNLKNLAKAWYREPGYKTLSKTLGYFKANVSEGLQENMQEAIARANIAHYVESYKKDGVSSALLARGVNGVSYQAQMATSASDYSKELYKEFTTAQGFETFMSGFMMGTFAKPLNNAVPFFSKHYNRMFNPADYKKWQENKTLQTELVVEVLNKFGSKDGMAGFLDNRIFNLALQEEVSNILKYGSKYEALNAHLDSFVSSVSIMRKTNTEDVFIEKLEHMLEMTDTELADSVKSLSPDKAPVYRERISKAISTLKNISAITQQGENLFPNPVNLNELDLSEEGRKNPETIKQLMLHDAWNQSVQNFVYLNAAFKDTAVRMEDIYRTYLQNTSLADVDYGAVKVLFKEEDIRNQIEILKTELKNAEPNSKKSKETQKQLELLERFGKAKSKFNAVYNIDEYYDNVKEQIVDEADQRGIKDFKPTEEEIIKRGDDLASIYEKQQDDMLKELKDAHDDYIKFLAKINESTVFQTNLDQAFEKLLDFYKLKYENRYLATSIDILTDPGGFLKLLDENQKMVERFEKLKPQIHEEVLDRENSDNEIKALINDLADIGLSISTTKEEPHLLDLKNNRVIPPYFLNFENNKVEKETPEYKAGLELVNKYLEISAITRNTVNPSTKQPIPTTMKGSVAKVRRLIAKSKLYKSTGLNYLLGKVLFDRVSNTVGEQIGEKYEYGYLKDVLTKESSPFNRIFKNVKLDDQNNVVSSGEFKFTEKRINAFIKGLGIVNKKFKDSGRANYGLDPFFLSILEEELLSILNEGFRPSVLAEMQYLDQELKRDDLTTEERVNIKKAFDKVSSQKNVEITEKNIKAVIEDVLNKGAYSIERERGNSLDEMVRDYFDTTVKDFKHSNPKYKDQITEQAFNNLFGEKGILKPLKDAQESGDIMIFSKDLTIGSSNMSNGKSVAGTMDLIAVDKNGKVYVIDLKSAKQKSWDNYVEDGSFDAIKFAKHSMQLLGYSNILYNEEGIEAETLVLPIASEEDSNGKITTVELPEGALAFERSKSDTLVKGKLFIDINRTDKKGRNVKIELSDRIGLPAGTVVDVNDIDISIPRSDTPPAEAGSSQGPATLTPFTKKGNVVVLGTQDSIDEKFLDDYLGKLVYVTLGIGGKAIVKNNPEEFAHTDDLFEQELDNIGFSKKKGESLNERLYRYTVEKNKAELDQVVLERVNDLISEGKTVITSTPSFIKNVSEDSVIVTAKLSNENFMDSFATEEEAMKFLDNEKLAIKNKDTNFVYLNFVDEITESTDTLALYKRLNKEKLTSKEKAELRLMIDVKANSLIAERRTEILKTEQDYIFLNDMKSKDVYSGDKLRVIAINSKTKNVIAKKTIKGKVKKIEMRYIDFVKGIKLGSDVDVTGDKDKTNSDAVKEYLNSLGSEMDSADKSKKTFDDFRNMSDLDKFNMYKCG